MNANKNKTEISVGNYLIGIGESLTEYDPQEVFDLSTFDDKEKEYTERDVYRRISEIHELLGVIVEQQKEIERLKAIISYLEQR